MSVQKREWIIRFGRKADVLGEFRVPMYRLSEKNLEEFLRAIVVSLCTREPAEMATFYLNKRRGVGGASLRPRIYSHFSYEKRESGYFCGDWESYAIAARQLSQDDAEAVHSHLNAGQGKR